MAARVCLLTWSSVSHATWCTLYQDMRKTSALLQMREWGGVGGSTGGVGVGGSTGGVGGSTGGVGGSTGWKDLLLCSTECV